MNRKLWIQKALSVCSMTAMIVTFSMVALAGPMAGELTVSGGSTPSSFVTVNGEPAESGRTVSPSSTITTPEGMTAVVNFGKLGKIQLGSNTAFTINADNNALSGSLSSGSITVLSAANGVAVRTANGESMTVSPGETASATGSTTKAATTATGSSHWWVFALVAGGATVAILLAATNGSDNKFGAGAITVSPVR